MTSASLPAPAARCRLRSRSSARPTSRVDRPHRCSRTCSTAIRGRAPFRQPQPSPRARSALVCRRSRAIGKPVDLALIAVPCAAVPDVLDDARARACDGSDPLPAPPATRPRRDAGSASSSRSRRAHASACSGRIRSASSAPTSASTRRSAPRSRCPAGSRCRAIGRGVHGDARLRGVGRHRLFDGGGAGRRHRRRLRRAARRARCTIPRPTASCSMSRASATRGVPVGAARGGAHQAGRRARGRALAGARCRCGRARRPMPCSTPR